MPMIVSQSTSKQPDLSRHALVRAQQRGVPKQVQEWLLQYGSRRYDHHGTVTRFFDGAARRRLAAAVGASAVHQSAERLRAYLVQSIGGGHVITVGKVHSGRRLKVN